MLYRAPFACSDLPRRDHFPSLRLEAGHFIERASDGGLLNPLRACPGDKMEILGDVDVRSAQT
jgi:hypothetical protein